MCFQFKNSGCIADLCNPASAPQKIASLNRFPKLNFVVTEQQTLIAIGPNAKLSGHVTKQVKNVSPIN